MHESGIYFQICYATPEVQIPDTPEGEKSVPGVEFFTDGSSNKHFSGDRYPMQIRESDSRSILPQRNLSPVNHILDNFVSKKMHRYTGRIRSCFSPSGPPTELKRTLDGNYLNELSSLSKAMASRLAVSTSAPLITLTHNTAPFTPLMSEDAMTLLRLAAVQGLKQTRLPKGLCTPLRVESVFH
ncbi:hypothetical protein BDZ97DRAFT_1751953 [Flammula alnicola]|nr:hypothetical protein BDZ97DRAFT_1751953 [Flammula alnicola]